MRDETQIALVGVGLITLLLSVVFISSILFPEKNEVRYIEGIIEDVEIQAGGHTSMSMITIHFNDGSIITFKFIDYIFVIGEKYNITYEFQPKSPYAKFKIINIEHLEVS